MLLLSSHSRHRATYHIVIESLQNGCTVIWTCRRAAAVDVRDILPLVDAESLVGVVEPGKVLEPLEPGGNRPEAPDVRHVRPSVIRCKTSHMFIRYPVSEESCSSNFQSQTSVMLNRYPVSGVSHLELNLRRFLGPIILILAHHDTVSGC